MTSDDETWLGESALETLRRLRPEEMERLAARLAAFRRAVAPLRAAASGEEPLFDPGSEDGP
jgi:DnaJ-domain-containing protein 1